MSSLNKVNKKIVSFAIIVIVIIGTYLFCHSTPERLIRTDLFLKGHFTDAFTTEIYKVGVDAQYGQFYSCKNPAIGPDFYSFNKKNGIWYINWAGTGGG